MHFKGKLYRDIRILVSLFFYFRIKDNITQSENGNIYLTDIEKKLKGKYTNQEIGRSMKQVFKGLMIKSVRNKEFWAKITKLYMGVEWIQSCNIVQPETENTNNNVGVIEPSDTEKHEICSNIEIHLNTKIYLDLIKIYRNSWK